MEDTMTVAESNNPYAADARFKGQTAIVTGAGSGIGRATAVRLVREGATVVATDVVEDRLTALVDELGEEKVRIVLGDIASDDIAQVLVAASDGRIDVLVNVAGIADRFIPVGELDDDLWHKVLAVNLTAVMRLTRAALPIMLAAGRGSIVNVGSEAGLRGSYAGAAYTTSKHALIGLTRSTSFIYAPQGIRANVVVPGAVNTAIEAPWGSELGRSRIEPLLAATAPEAATSEQLAASICWLASDDSANVNGTILQSDGGWAAK
jgi:NAD(P)-dependent dehydrogenase (short-subunit alcohol dehydrogenase family)